MGRTTSAEKRGVMTRTAIAGVALSLCLIAGLAAAAPAAAQDVRYCLALDPRESTAYFSDIFETSAANEEIEKSFARALDAESIAHRIVSCPRSDDEAAALIARKQAIAYNMRRGKAVRNIPWSPDQRAAYRRTAP